MPRRKTFANDVAVGAITAFFFNTIWWFFTGSLPPLWLPLTCGGLGMIAWSVWQGVLFEKAWGQVLAAYDRPAYGEDDQ